MRVSVRKVVEKTIGHNHSRKVGGGTVLGHDWCFVEHKCVCKARQFAKQWTMRYFAYVRACMYVYSYVGVTNDMQAPGVVGLGCLD